MMAHRWLGGVRVALVCACALAVASPAWARGRHTGTPRHLRALPVVQVRAGAAGDSLYWQSAHETVLIEPHGQDGIRVRATPASQVRNDTYSLLLPTPTAAARPRARGKVKVDAAGLSTATLTNGLLTVTVAPAMKGPRTIPLGTSGALSISFYQGTRLLLTERYPLHGRRARYYEPVGGAASSRTFRASTTFESPDTERIYGLGQHQLGLLDQKGVEHLLRQFNTEVPIPFLLSSRLYGFLWNTPSRGRFVSSRRHTRWESDATAQLDYVVFAGTTYGDILGRLVDATGHSPALPAFASGYVQCKLRYANQWEVLNVTREFVKRELPLAMIVIDYHNWKLFGDWSFDPAAWPNPTAMVDEVHSHGAKVMVSVWPNVEMDNHAVWDPMSSQRLLVGSQFGTCSVGTGLNNAQTCEYDPFSSAARSFVWDRLSKGYAAHGIGSYWLDSDEGGGLGEASEDGGPLMAATYAAGSGVEVGNAYPLEHARMIYDGVLADTGAFQSLSLTRAFTAGSQRYGAALWSGDILSTFESLELQVTAGLNAQMSGVAWWTTDGGGFMGGNISDPAFGEVVTRWLEFSTFSPLMRMHGIRECLPSAKGNFTTCPNEPWSYGPAVYANLRRLILLRQKLRPYIQEQAALTSKLGLPLQRPPFFDFEATDPSVVAQAAPTDFLFGHDVLVSPILKAGQTSQAVYLPKGPQWQDCWTGAAHPGGAAVTVAAPLGKPAVFLRLPANPLLVGLCSVEADV